VRDQFLRNILTAEMRHAQSDPNDWRTDYDGFKQLPATGEYAGVRQMGYTGGLHVGLTDAGYAWRYCYPTAKQALEALAVWDGAGDPPGPWIKLKGHPDGDRLGPGAVG
jgi:hypothetical protein